jgi:signal peptidase II
VVKMQDKGLIEVTPNFNFRMVWNRGVSFGMFSADSQSGRYALIAFALVVVSLLLVWLMRAKTRILAWAIGLVVGGAIGNVVDRAFYGAVADFFDLHAMGYHFYTFNLADTAISLGVVLLIFEAIFSPQHLPGNKATQKT